MSGLLGLLLATVVGFGGPAGFLNLPVHVPPYGGCKEAVNYPGTPGARDCGWVRMPHPAEKEIGHSPCWMLVGDTTLVSCRDGHMEVS